MCSSEGKTLVVATVSSVIFFLLLASLTFMAPVDMTYKFINDYIFFNVRPLLLLQPLWRSTNATNSCLFSKMLLPQLKTLPSFDYTSKT
jgi:hypothetical protein